MKILINSFTHDGKLCTLTSVFCAKVVIDLNIAVPVNKSQILSVVNLLFVWRFDDKKFVLYTSQTFIT